MLAASSAFPTWLCGKFIGTGVQIHFRHIYSLSYLGSSFIRSTSFAALYGMSVVVAMFSATLNWAVWWTLYESNREYLERWWGNSIIHFTQQTLTYPNSFGLNSLRMFGNVRCVLQVPCPPMHHARPRFSISSSHRAMELAAVALVRESPTAEMMSMSPGRSWWTLVGTLLLRIPLVSHGKGTFGMTCGWRNAPCSRPPVGPSNRL